MTTEQGPWEVKFFDPSGDDNRGSSHTVGTYRSYERARQHADTNNAELLARINKEAQRLYDKSVAGYHQRALEHNALVDAGLRQAADGYSGRDCEHWPLERYDEFVPRTELKTFDNRPADHKNWWSEDHYYVEAIEFDD